MRLLRILLATFAVALASPANAQYTQEQLQNLFNTNLPTTGTGYISAALLRSTLNAMAASWIYYPTTSLTLQTISLNGTITGSTTIAPFSYGTLAYSDVNIWSSFNTSVNGYAQSIWQNSSAGAAASTDLIVSNNLGTATAYYGNFGINSSTFSGSGSLNLPNAIYVYGASGDLVLGTTTANTIRFVANSAAIDAMTISPSNQVVITPQTYASLSSPTLGTVAVISDGKASNCGDAACTTWGTTVTGGTGALKLKIWYNGTNWTLAGK